MPVRRKQTPSLVNPGLAIQQEQLRGMGLVPGREMVLRSEENRKLDLTDRAPVSIQGNTINGSGLRAVVSFLASMGMVTDDLEDGGGFGVREFPYANLTEPISPRAYAGDQIGADVTSTSNTAIFSQAMDFDVLLGVGNLWSALVLGWLDIRNDGGSSKMRLEIEGANYDTAARTVPSGTYATFKNAQEVNDIPGESTLDCRILYQPSSAGTALGANPMILVYVWRQE